MTILQKNKYSNWALASIIIIIPLIIGVCNEIKGRSALKNTVIIVGEIEAINPTRGAKVIKVRYNYNGKIINGEFETYHIDSLKIKKKVILKVSRDYPTEFIKYIGVYNPSEGDSK